MDDSIKKELSATVTQPVIWDCALSAYTSFRIGGPARALVEISHEDELEAVLAVLQKYGLPWRVIGRGTNLLVSDSGYQGVVICLGAELKKWTAEGQAEAVRIFAGAGVSLVELSAKCAEEGYSGLEFGIGIPASLGGSVVMNAGAWGRCISDIIQSVTIVSAAGVKCLQRRELHFGYRKWHELEEIGPCVITRLELLLHRAEVEEVRQTCRNYTKERRARQPVGVANAGSIFKNPPNDSAGRLIEESGLKGYAVGQAEVSTKHANFIVNKGGAKAEEVLQLIGIIQREVMLQKGIHLEPEVHIL